MALESYLYISDLFCYENLGRSYYYMVQIYKRLLMYIWYVMTACKIGCHDYVPIRKMA